MPTYQRLGLGLLSMLLALAAGLTYWSWQRGVQSSMTPPDLNEISVADQTTPQMTAATPTESAAAMVTETVEETVGETSTEATEEATEEVIGQTADSLPAVEPPHDGTPTQTGTDATAARSDNEGAPAASVNSDSQVAANPTTPLRFTQLADGPISTLNPLFATTAAERAVVDKIFPSFLTLEAQSGLILPGDLVESWQVATSSDVYTFTLRSDVRWSDGTSVTAADAAFTFAAQADAAVDSPYRATMTPIAAVNALDDRTVAVTLTQADCSAVYALARPLLPSHRYAADFSDMATSPLNTQPTTTAGPFRFVTYLTPAELPRASESDGATSAVLLAADPQFHRGTPIIQEYVVSASVAPETDAAALADTQARALATQAAQLLQPAPANFEPFAGVATVALTKFPATGYSFMAVNLADPTEPLAGQNASGAPQTQPPHPILGDRRVRQAIAAALDYDTLLRILYGDSASGESAYRSGSYISPAVQWAYNATLAAPSLDPARAGQLLDEAGWIDEAGDGVRTRGGSPLALSVLVNNDSPVRMQVAQQIADDLAQVGFTIRLEALPFDATATRVLAQEYDLALLGWENLSADPGAMPFWHTRDDQPGRGFNFVSFQDAEVDRLLDEAQTMPGCDMTARAERYRAVQARIADEAPYIIIGGPQAVWVHDAQWRGLTPGPWAVDTNIEQWQPTAP